MHWLFSGKDNMLPSEDEAKRLSSVLKNCVVRTFKENGHTLLLVGFLLCGILKDQHDSEVHFCPPLWRYIYFSGGVELYERNILFKKEINFMA